jgi:LPS-assembly protein
MPIDELRQSSRWGLSYQHTGLPDARRPVAFNLNLNRVSDSHYWEDFTTNPSDPLVQRSLLNSGSVAWGMGQFGTSIVVNQWQTQQGTTASTAIAPAYDRLPQINVNYLRADMAGFDWQLNSELTRFSVNRNFYCSFYSNSAYCNQPTGARIVLNQQITRPFVNAFGHVTPKWMFNARQYQYENAYRGIDGSSSPVDSNAVNVPTFSLDAGMVLERSMAWSDQRWLQTLEPRAFYVKTPYRNQSDLPNFDTGLNDYNFASIFSENTFSGQDRVSDSHTLTLGVSTRFIQPDSGAEGARLGLAQRYRLSDQNVQLTPQTAVMKSGNSDILAGASLYVTPRLTLDSLIDYSDQEQRLERSSVGARYNPSAYRVINTAYRYQRASSEVVDLSWQWPVNDLWRDLGVDRQQGQGLGGGRLYSIGRLNFNLLDNRLVDSMLGLEYDGGCWVSRFALQRTQLTLSTSTTSLMFQLEFNDFSRLGVGNVGLARDNISRYQNLREPFKFSPSPFAAYD